MVALRPPPCFCPGGRWATCPPRTPAAGLPLGPHTGQRVREKQTPQRHEPEIQEPRVSPCTRHHPGWRRSGISLGEEGAGDRIETRVLGRAPACGDSGWGRGRCSGLWVAGGRGPGGTQGEAASGGDACSPARSLGRRAQQNPQQPIPEALPLEPEPRAVPAIGDSKPSGTRGCCTCAPAGCALLGVVRGSLRPNAAPASEFSVSVGREPPR